MPSRTGRSFAALPLAARLRTSPAPESRAISSRGVARRSFATSTIHFSRLPARAPRAPGCSPQFFHGLLVEDLPPFPVVGHGRLQALPSRGPHAHWTHPLLRPLRHQTLYTARQNRRHRASIPRRLDAPSRPELPRRRRSLLLGQRYLIIDHDPLHTAAFRELLTAVGASRSTNLHADPTSTPTPSASFAQSRASVSPNATTKASTAKPSNQSVLRSRPARSSPASASEVRPISTIVFLPDDPRSGFGHYARVLAWRPAYSVSVRHVTTESIQRTGNRLSPRAALMYKPARIHALNSI